MRYIRLIFWPVSWLLKGLLHVLRRFVHVGDGARHRAKAQRVATTMIHEFSRQGFARTTGTKKKKKRQRVVFEQPLLLTQDELWCPIALNKLPTGVQTDHLRAPEVLQSMEDRLRLPVRFDALPNGKFCFVVRMSGSAFPPVFSINDFQMAADAPPLAIPLGVDRDGEHQAADLTELKHLLVAGATGGGKTTFMHSIINALISRNGPQDIELWLLDLKGSEFPRYRSLMGNKQEAGVVRYIATEPDRAIEVLDLAYKEIRRRNEMMQRFDASNLDDLARLSGQRLRRIVLIFDEFAILTLDKSKIGKQSIGQWGTFLMTKIAALGRSAGVTIVIATQFVNKEVMSGTIRANFENRITFSCADWRQSQLVIETSEADGLPVGRAVIRREGRTAEVQTCLITPHQTRLEVARIAEYGPDGGLGDRDELDLFVRDAKLLLATSCDLLDGDFSRPKLLGLPDVRKVISQPRYHEIARRLEQDGVIEPGKGRNGRRVARGYFGRPQLLDLLYQVGNRTPNSTETEKPEAVSCEVPVSPPLEPQNEQNSASVSSGLAVSCYQPESTHVIEHDETEESPDSNEEAAEEEPPAPGWLKQVEDKIQREVEDKKKRKG